MGIRLFGLKYLCYVHAMYDTLSYLLCDYKQRYKNVLLPESVLALCKGRPFLDYFRADFY